jgi:hypothetical protein
MNLIDLATSSSLTFECGDLPADTAISAAGHEPNGYFWEGVAQYLNAALASRVELDCEAGMFCARGDRAALGQLRGELEPYLDDPERIAQLIRDAEASASKIRRPSRPSMATSAKSYRFGDRRAAVSSASNCRRVNPRVGDSAGTAGRRTCSAGECSRMPSRAQVR